MSATRLPLVRSSDYGQRTNRLYGNYAPPLPATSFAAWRYLVDLIERNVQMDYDNVVVITGPPGSAKSTLGLTLGREVDPTFTPEHVAYDAKDTLRLMHDLHHGQVLLFDEAILDLLSSETFTKEERALLQAFNIVRAKGLIMVLCIPDIWDLAKGLRARRADLWVHCQREPRGVGTLYTRDYRARFKPTSNLPLWRDPDFPTVKWRTLDGTPLWDSYLSLKMARIQTVLEGLGTEIAGDGEDDSVTDDEIVAALAANAKLPLHQRLTMNELNYSLRKKVGVGRIYGLAFLHGFRRKARG